MLHTATVKPELLELLAAMMNESAFDSFVLVGGTSLALQYGHRDSIDLDFFGNQPINEQLFLSKLALFGGVQLIKKSDNILICSVNDIKVDLVSYQYAWIRPVIHVDKVRLASDKDIAAMKLNAISGRGSKKDFIDLYFILQRYSLSDVISFYNDKYPDGSVFMVLKSLSYFEDADLELSPRMYIDVQWDEIKAFISEQLKHI
jgi:predicted nucleotidyltransferase component of viral defense system